MSHHYREPLRINITMSPAELRKLATKMEEVWPTLRLGQTTFVDFLAYHDDYIVCLNLDQQYFQRPDYAPQEPDPVKAQLVEALQFVLRGAFVDGDWSKKAAAKAQAALRAAGVQP